MISNNKTFGNDKHTRFYISADELLEGGDFRESSYIQNNVYVNNVSQISSFPGARFGNYYYNWGTTPTEDNRGLSASTSSDYYTPNTKDFAIDTWFKFIQPGTYGATDIFAMADSTDPVNNHLLIQVYASSASTSLWWYFYLRNSGTYILQFARQQSARFTWNAWHQFTFSRKNLHNGSDSYSFYIGRTTERHSYWFTGATAATQNFNWTKPVIYLGKATGGILPWGYSHSLINTSIDTFRISIGNARKWARDATTGSGQFNGTNKPVYFTPNRAY